MQSDMKDKAPIKKLMEFLLQKEFESWADKNPTFIEDIDELIHRMVVFEMKYGIRILYEMEKGPKHSK
jgi:hypothetical protein